MHLRLGSDARKRPPWKGSPFTADLAVIDFNPLEEQGPFEVEKRLAQTDRSMH
jgi:hypothetical protein